MASESDVHGVLESDNVRGWGYEEMHVEVIESGVDGVLENDDACDENEQETRHAASESESESESENDDHGLLQSHCMHDQDPHVDLKKKLKQQAEA